MLLVTGRSRCSLAFLFALEVWRRSVNVRVCVISLIHIHPALFVLNFEITRLTHEKKYTFLHEFFVLARMPKKDFFSNSNSDLVYYGEYPNFEIAVFFILLYVIIQYLMCALTMK